MSNPNTNFHKKTIRTAFAQIMQQVSQAMPNVQDGFPKFQEDVSRVMKEAGEVMEEAFACEAEEQMFWMSNFANRLGALKELLENPTPGRSFNINEHIINGAFRIIEQALLRKYEISLPKEGNLPEIYLD